MKILNSNVINEGKVIDNYLTNFPLFINKLKNSMYKLVIGLNNSVFVVDIPSANTYIKLPYYDNELITSNMFISWGDGELTRDDNKNYWNLTITSLPPFTSALYDNNLEQLTFDLTKNIIYDEESGYILNGSEYIFNEDVLLITNFYTHLYKNSGRYTINVFGDTTDLYSIDYKRVEEKSTSMEDNFFSGLIDIKKLSDSLTNLSAIFKNYPKLSGIPDYALPINVKNCDLLFAGCTGITYIPFEFDLPEGGTSYRAMFSGCTNLSTIFNLNLALSFGTEEVREMFSDTIIELVPKCFFNNVTSSLTNLDGMFSNCTRLFKVDANKDLPYITSLMSTFYNCQILNNMDLNFKNIYNLYQTFYNCRSLTGIGNLQINDKTSTAVQTFYNCSNLLIKVNDILDYNGLDNRILLSTFYNCNSLKGTLKELELWKAKNVNKYYYLRYDDKMLYTLNIKFSLEELKLLSSLYVYIDTFGGEDEKGNKTLYHCDEIENYNFIDPSWGGPFNMNDDTSRLYELTYWYGSYEILIKNINSVYCLPLYKFTTGNEYKETVIFDTEENIEKVVDNLSLYDFYINYGDDTAWLHILIDKDPIFSGPSGIWNLLRGIYYGYPNTYKIGLSDDKYSAYDLLMDDFFCYIYKNICHKYNHIGKYKISIIGKVPRFYVHENDLITNSYITNIITINRLPFVSLKNAFRNSGIESPSGLPNESLEEFPLLEVEDILDAPYKQQMLDTDGCFNIHLKGTLKNPVPPQFKILGDNAFK